MLVSTSNTDVSKIIHYQFLLVSCSSLRCFAYSVTYEFDHLETTIDSMDVGHV